jgi:hypothetical protein
MIVTTEIVRPRWSGVIVVAATGPSLTEEVADMCRGHRVIAVNDAYRLMSYADVLYACDAAWWKVHKGCPGFAGEKWSSHDDGSNDKLDAAEKYGLRLVSGANDAGFSRDQSVVHYGGGNSGFQAVNLAIHFAHRPGGV